MLYENYMVAHLRSISRALLATIRNLGDFPCPRCLTPLSLAHMFGTSDDKEKRINEARVDNKVRRDKISRARKLIYGKLGAAKKANFGVTSAAVERILKGQSLVPTDVCFSLIKTMLFSP